MSSWRARKEVSERSDRSRRTAGETWGARAFIGKLEKGNQAECLMLLKKLTELLQMSCNLYNLEGYFQ